MNLEDLPFCYDFRSGVLKKTLIYFLVTFPLPVILGVLEEFAFTPVMIFPTLLNIPFIGQEQPEISQFCFAKGLLSIPKKMWHLV